MTESARAAERICDDLRFYGTTLNECPDVRALLRRAATEMDRLESLIAPVTCLNCHQPIERAGDWYRCFDCKAHLCETCVTKHFGDKYTPHHQTVEQERIRADIASKAAHAAGRHAMREEAATCAETLRPVGHDYPAQWHEIASAIRALKVEEG